MQCVLFPTIHCVFKMNRTIDLSFCSQLYVFISLRNEANEHLFTINLAILDQKWILKA